MHLVRFIIRIYHDARSFERQNKVICFKSNLIFCIFSVKYLLQISYKITYCDSPYYHF